MSSSDEEASAFLIVQSNPPLVPKWYSPVIFHAPHCPRMWVGLNVHGNKSFSSFSLYPALLVSKTKNIHIFFD